MVILEKDIAKCKYHFRTKLISAKKFLKPLYWIEYSETINYEKSNIWVYVQVVVRTLNIKSIITQYS